ncbi:SDR family oxidoreductase [Altibacter sp. HG106]|uniref:SDR family oxidoreductase n=1 Tax=Altibacter sp. HG106 TaxID=3023937 RepID=UPI00234FCAAF|nr:SDR family oxidoreductase [Altibacter sp. HG106]MDC7993572.1 SDR family oxidoreductase [Altibacter sp. HG106]
MSTLHGKVAFITGGTKGIGYGIAQALLKQGVHVAITSRSQDAAQEAVRRLNEYGNDSAYVKGFEADVRDLASQEHAVEKTVEAFGAIDIVIANAGLGHFDNVETLTPEQWKETIDTNLTGVFYTLKATLTFLKKSKGYYMTISSLAGTNFFAGGAAYNASKFGVTGFTQAAMLDLRKYDIKTTTIMPGSVATHFNGNEPDDSDAWKIQIEDIGQMVVQLLQLPARTLPSKVEVRPTRPPSS